MASINEKLNYINETKSLIKNKLNDLGSGIENETTFREYAEKIENLYEEWPKINNEDTNIILNNSKEGKMKLILKGNTEQFITTGKNKLSNDVVTENQHGVQITKNSDGSVTLNGTSTESFNIVWKDTITLAPGTYYVGLVTTTSKFNLYFNKSGGGFEILGSPANSSYYTLTLAETTTFPGFKSYIGAAGKVFNNETFYPMITTTLPFNYEPYTGGIASPNPDYPQEVNVVSGDNTIIIEGKNKINLNDVKNENNSLLEITSTGFNVTRKQDAGYGDQFIATIKIEHLKANTTYTFSLNVESQNSFSNGGIYAYSDQLFGTALTKTNYESDGNYRKWNITTNDKGVILIGFYGVTSTKDKIFMFTNIQLEEGNLNTLYEPYQSQNYSINLNTIKLCKIDTYQDYIYKNNNKWYKNEKIQKITLDGTQTWNRDKELTNSWRFYTGQILPTSIAGISKSNRFINVSMNDLNNVDSQGICRIYDGQIGVRINKTIAETIQEFKTWQSNNNIDLYYVLSTPLAIEITDENLINQLNILEQAISYNTQTNIFQENDNLPFVINATALMKNSD